MIIVQKFGGTSLATIECINRVSNLIKHELDKGNQLVVVVSAMGDFTDVLANYIGHFAVENKSAAAEYDVVLSAGEQISTGLLSLALISLGIKARSWLGWQLPISTDDHHMKAEITEVQKNNIINSLANNEVPIVAGFQGIHGERITTIGRGGSDISAVEIAASINADRCDIYTDVEGIYTADPNLVPRAQKLSVITYDEMLEMAAMGAQVLHSRSVESAMHNKMRLQVLSSFNNKPGTLLIRQEEDMRNKPVTAVTCNNDEACISVCDIENLIDIFSPLAQANIGVNIIVQDINSSNITFTVLKSDLNKTIKLLEKFDISVDEKVSIVSVIGIGMLSNAGVASKMFVELASNNIKTLAITTSEIKISVILHEEYRELAVRLLHSAYDLDCKISK